MENKKYYTHLLNIICIILYAAVTLFTVLHHEVWRDEAQVWLVVRDLNIIEVIKHVRIEGHPLLWYFMVFPFAKTGLSVLSMQVVSWLFMTAAAAVFLWKSPFNILSKVCVLFSAGFVYWLPVLSRSYSLIPLLIFLLAIFYPQQKEKPYHYAIVLALLSQTHVLMCSFCTVMGALFFYDNIFKNKDNLKKYIAPFLITFLPVLFLSLYIFTCPHKNESVSEYIMLADGFWTKTFITYMINLFGVMGNIRGILLSLLLIGSGVIIFVENKRLFAAFLVNIAYQFVIYNYIWMSAPEKVWAGLTVLLFCFWVVFLQNELNLAKKIVYNLVLILFFGLSIPLGIQLIKNDLKYDYSGSKATAQFIKNNIDKNDIIVTNRPIFTSSIAVYAKGYKFYYPQTGSFYTYGYDTRADEFVPPEIQEKNMQKFKNKKIYYLFSSLAVPEEEVLYKSKPATLLMTERFYILDNLNGIRKNDKNKNQ